MSMQHPHEVKCPKCGTENSILIHDSINVSLEPDNKAKVLDRSLFQFCCSKCGEVTGIEYCPLYHDMDEKYMIMVANDRKSAADAIIPDIGKNTNFSMFADGYRFRVVYRIAGLIEKIKIFDNKLDDFAVEMLKLMLYGELNQPAEIIFCDVNEKKISFWVYYEDSKNNKGISVDRKYYDSAVQIVNDENINKLKIQYVDMRIIAQALNEKEKR